MRTSKNGTALKLISSAQITLSKIYDAYTINLSNSNFDIVCNDQGDALAGEIGANGRAITTTSVVMGAKKFTAVASNPTAEQYCISISEQVGCTAAKNGNDNIYIDTLSNSIAGKFSISFNIEGTTTVVKDVVFVKKINDAPNFIDGQFSFGAGYWSATKDGTGVLGANVTIKKSNEAIYGTNLLEIANETWFYSKKYIDIEKDRIYRCRFRAKQSIDNTTGNKIAYFGYTPYNSSGTAIGTNGANNMYFASGTLKINTWTEWEYYISTKARAEISTIVNGVKQVITPAVQAFPTGAVKFKPMFIVNYHQGNGIALADGWILEDVTEKIEVSQLEYKASQIETTVNGIDANVISIKTYTDMSSNPMTLAAKANYSAYDTPNQGEVYLHGLNYKRNPADIDGKCIWNTKTVSLPKVMFNPNSIVPDGVPVYMVRNIADNKWWSVWKETNNSTITWKRALADVNTSSTIYAHTWNEANDIVVGYYVIKKTNPRDGEASIVIAQLFDGALNYKQATSMTLVGSISQLEILESEVNLKVANTDNKVSQLKLEADKITQRVQSTEQTVTNHTTQLNQVDSKINNAVNNINIGGRNLLTKDIFENGNLSGPDGSLIDGAANYYRTKNFIEVDSNKQYTLKINKCNSNDKIEKIIAYTANGEFISTHYIQSTETIFTCPSNCKKIKFICIVNNAQTFSITEEFKIKLERGNKATDYSPAPEDIDNSISSVDSKIETTKNKVAEIVTNIDSITQRVQSTESNVSIVTNNLSNLQIGGRNIALGTNQGTGWYWALENGSWSGSEVIENGIRCSKLTRDDTPATGWSYIAYERIGRNKYVAGKKYTVSFEVKASVPAHFTCSFLEGNSSNGLTTELVRATVYEANKWTKLVFNVTMKDELPDSTSQVLYLNEMNAGVGVSYIFRNLMIEEGTKASAWSPAPEDIYSDIGLVDNKIETTKNKVSEIVTSLDGISLKVQSTEQAVTNHASQLGQVDNKITNAVNDIKIGGRNIIKKKSDFTYGWIGHSSGEIVDTGSLNNNQDFYTNEYFELKQGETIHFNSYANKNIDSWIPAGVYIHVYNHNKEWQKCIFNEKGVNTDAKTSYTATENCYVRFNSRGYEHYNHKAEYGTKVTDWTPAPEDINNAISSVDSKIETTSNKLAKLTLTTDSIAQRVQSTESNVSTITTNFNNLKIGGRNLLWNSGFKKGMTYWEGHACNDVEVVSDSNAISGYAVKFTSTGDGGIYQRKSSGYYPAGTILTVSGYVKSNITGKIFDINFENADSSNTFKRIVCENSNTWYYFTYTHTVAWNTFNTVTFYGQTGAEYHLKDLKLEEGNKPTSWTEASEDINNAILQIDSKIETTKNQVASIETSLSGITQRVQSTESTITTHTTQLGQVDNKINNAVNDLQIGGRNLWRFTKEYDGSKYDKWCDNNEGNSDLTPPHTHINGFGVQRIAWAWHDMSQRVPIEPYTNYTLSAWIKWENEIGELMFYTNSGTMNNTNLTSQVGTSDFKRVSITFNSNDGDLSTCRFECTSGIPYLIYGFKLEKGNKATDWTPAPEDIDNSINNVDNKIENLQIGGRNLALKTSSSYSIPYSSFDGNQNKCPALATVLTDGLQVGDTVTVRLLYKYTDIIAAHGKTAICRIQGYGNVTEWNSGGFNGSSELVLTGSGEHEFLYSFEVIADHLKNSAWLVDIRHDWIQSGSVQWKSFKVEKGNKATDWSPAPEDIDSAIYDRIIYARGTGCDYLNNRILRIGKKTIYDDTGRGVRVTALDPATLEIRSDDIYDLHEGGHHETNFVNKINELNEGYYIIVVTSWDNAYLHWGVRCEALYKIGGFAPNPSLDAYREAYALIGKSGLGKGNGIEMYIPRTDQDHRHAEVSVKVGQNGEFVGVNSPNLGHQIDTIDTKIETTKNRVSEIATSLDGINLKVQSTEQTVINHATQLGQVDNKITNTNNKIDNLAIGGRNLLLDSGTAVTNNEYCIKTYTPSELLIAGETYTVTICVTPANNVQYFMPYMSGGYAPQHALTVNGTNKQVVSGVFKASYYPDRVPTNPSDGHARISVYRFPNDGTVVTDSTMHWIKIEKGNKATDWTPAPEDINNSISDVNAKIEITKNNLAELKLTTDSITQRVESSETRINTLQIGGRNLFLKSDIDKYGIGNWSNNGNGTGIVEGTYIDGTKTIKIVGGEGISYNSYIKLKRNTEYIYSMMIKSSSALNVGASNPLHMWISEVDNGSGHNEIILSHSEHISANTWTKAYIVFKTPNTQDVYYMKPFIYGIGDNTVYISKVQVEEGNKATDWSPAPEDIISEISDVNSKVAEVKVTADSIVQKVSKTEQIAMIPQDSKMLNTDPTFYKGYNDIWVYNNNNNGTVTVSRVSKSNDCPTTSGYMLEITTNGNASPYLGGFTFGTWTRANAVYITRLIAKLPEGSWLSWHTNQIGDGGYSEWLTDNKGTGTWKEYLCKVVCGSSGQFHNTNYFALVNAANPVTWHVAFATVYDITETNGLETRISNAEQKITDSAIINTVSSTINNKVNTALNDLKIGGRNLAKNSATLNDSFSELNSFKGTRTILDDSSAKCGKVIKIECTTAGSGFYFGIWDGDASCIEKQFTWSFYVKMNKNRTLGSVGHEKGGVTTISATTEWTKVYHTWTYSKDGYSAFICYPNFDSGDIIYIKDFKIEEGSKATDWTPAPEDIDSAIANVDDKVATTINKVAELKLTADSITQRVESNENTVSNLTNNLNNLKIGGRNLAFKNAISAFGASSINLDNYIKRGDITAWKPNGEYNGGFHFDKLIGYKPETRYVVQFYMTCIEHTVKNIHFHNGQNIIKSDVYIDDNYVGVISEIINTSVFDDRKTHKIRMEYTTPAALVDSSGGTSQIYFQPNKSITDPYTVFIQEFKVEEGNKATAWTPATEDISNSIDNIDNKIETTKNRVSEIATSLDGINLKVQSTEQTVTNHATQLNQVDNKINNAVNNIKIGGRNIIKKKSQFTYGYLSRTDGYVFDVGHLNSNQDFYANEYFELKKGETIWFSLYKKDIQSSIECGVYIHVYNLNKAWLMCEWKESPANTNIQVSYTATENCYVRFNSRGYEHYNHKAEYGTKVTDWTPAPEDIDSDINNVDNKVTTTISKLAEIKLTTDSITQRVESSEQIINNKEDKKSRYIFAKGTGNDYYANSYVEVEGRCLTDGQGRGLRIHALNPETLNCFFIQDYDTFASDDAVNSFNAKINELNAGYHIIIVTSLDASYPWRCKESLRKIGGSLLPDTTDTYREAYALIGKSGLGQGNGVEMYIPKTETDKRHAEVSVKIGQKGEFMGVNHSNSVSQIEILKNEIGLKVQKNNVISSINLYTQDDENGGHSGVKIRGDKIDLQGQVTFSSLADSNVSGSIKNIFTQQDNQTVINGGMIKTHTIKGNDLLLKGNMSVTDNSGNKTFEITDAGEVNIQARSLRIGSSNVATNNDIDVAVSNIQSGGNNLAIGTDKANGDVYEGHHGSPYIATDLFGGITAITTSTAWSGRYFNLKAIAQRGGFKVGDNLVLSVYIKSDQNVTLNVTSHRTTSTGNTAGSSKAYNNFTVTPKWQQVWFPFTADEGSLSREDTRIEVNQATGANAIHWAGWKLEKGTKPTDWTPATQDINTALNKKVDNTQEAIFNKLFANGQQGFVLENGRVYINGEYIKANTINGSTIKAGTLDASKIKTGIIQASTGGSYFNLNNGSMLLGTKSSYNNYLEWTGSSLNIKSHTTTLDSSGLTIKNGALSIWDANNNKKMVYLGNNGNIVFAGDLRMELPNNKSKYVEFKAVPYSTDIGCKLILSGNTLNNSFSIETPSAVQYFWVNKQGTYVSNNLYITSDSEYASDLYTQVNFDDGLVYPRLDNKGQLGQRNNRWKYLYAVTGVLHDLSVNHALTAGDITCDEIYCIGDIACDELSCTGNVKIDGRRAVVANGTYSSQQVKGLAVRDGSSSKYLEVQTFSGSAYGVNLNVSDRNMKENVKKIAIFNDKINPLNDHNKIGLEAVMSLEHYEFDYKEEGLNHVDCGYIAQQLKEVNSNFAYNVKQENDEDLYCPDMTALMPNLSMAIQQQQQYIQKLELRIEELEKVIDKLRA